MTLTVLRSLICVVLVLVSSSVNGATIITINDVTYTFNKPPRLADVLAPVALQEDWYWPASNLFLLKDTEINKKRDEVIAKLEKLHLSVSSKAKEQQALTTFIKQIKEWKLAKRVQLVIDYDFARIEANLNPMFEEGNYLLNLVTRPSKINVFGALSGETTISHKNVADVSDYLSELSVLHHGNKDYVYIIQADCKAMQVPYAYWNKGHQEIMPGSQLYIPFKTQFFATDNQQLNEQIVFLATNRILP